MKGGKGGKGRSGRKESERREGSKEGKVEDREGWKGGSGGWKVGNFRNSGVSEGDNLLKPLKYYGFEGITNPKPSKY